MLNGGTFIGGGKPGGGSGRNGGGDQIGGATGGNGGAGTGSGSSGGGGLGTSIGNGGGKGIVESEGAVLPVIVGSKCPNVLRMLTAVLSSKDAADGST